jgi:hypothetical protein
VVAAWRAGTGKSEAGPGRGVGQRSDAAAAWPRRVRVTRRGTSCARPNRGGGERLTGGPWAQCRVAALTDRWARAAQCVRFNSV